MRTERRLVFLASVAVAALLLLPSPAYAYVGPGGVITAIGAALALLVAIVASIVGFLWYPLKRVMVSLRSRRARGEAEGSASSADPTSG